MLWKYNLLTINIMFVEIPIKVKIKENLASLMDLDKLQY